MIIESVNNTLTGYSTFNPRCEICGFQVRKNNQTWHGFKFLADYADGKEKCVFMCEGCVVTALRMYYGKYLEKVKV